MNLKKLISIVVAAVFLGVAGLATYLIVIISNLPNMITVEDYEPLLVSQVYDRKGNKIGEFFREKRILMPYEKIPQHIVHAFLAAEDSSFFEHGGVNYQSIMRAMLANIKAGRKVQGGSTITQQVSRSLLLTNRKTYTRKIKEIVLAYRMENNLSKEEILWLYLNQIYLGQGSYGVGAAAQIYFRKELKDISIAEAALLAGLPQAPSRYSPIHNPSKAKARQRYVLKRMAEEGFIAPELAESESEMAVQVYVRKDYKELAPFYLETVRQLLVKHLGEVEVLDKGLKIYTSLDLEQQVQAKSDLRKGLRSLDKRQGYRGPKQNITEAKEIAKILLDTRDNLIDEVSPVRLLRPDGTIPPKGPLNLTGLDSEGNPLPNIPHYVSIDQIVDAVVTDVNDKWGIVKVRFAESRALIDFETMKWARVPNPNVRSEYDEVKNPSDVLKKGDLIEVRVEGKKFYSSRLNKEISDLKRAHKGKDKWQRPDDLPDFAEYAEVELEQEPLVEGAVFALDQSTQDVVTLIGGYDFGRSQYNRALQATRQTGSAFKSIVYASALDKGYTPATPIIDAPVVFEEEGEKEEGQESTLVADGTEEAEDEAVKRWKPMNHSKRFLGDILFRNAIIRSLNVPTVKIIEKLGVDWVAHYARRLGIFSPLNMDYTLALGSSGVTLYEMTKAFAQIGKLGRRVKPIIIHKVESQTGEVLLEKLSLDDRFDTEITAQEEEFEKRRLAYLAFEKAHPEITASETKSSDKGDPNNDEAPEVQESAPEEPVVAATTGPENSSEDVFKFTKAKFLKEPHTYFDDPDQLIDPKIAYVATSLLVGVIDEPRGTGGPARALGRPVAGKTGTTSGYYDAWFIGFTPNVASGVWVGYDEEKTLGRGEVGTKAALPIWLDYMKHAHEGVAEKSFAVPEGIVFANIDNETGKLANASSAQVIRQAFVEGTEPTELSKEVESQDDKNFYKEELSE